METWLNLSETRHFQKEKEKLKKEVVCFRASVSSFLLLCAEMRFKKVKLIKIYKKKWMKTRNSLSVTSFTTMLAFVDGFPLEDDTMFSRFFCLRSVCVVIAAELLTPAQVGRVTLQLIVKTERPLRDMCRPACVFLCTAFFFFFLQ